MCTLYSHSSPSWMRAKPSLSWADPARSDLTSVPVSTRPHSSLSRNSNRCDACRFVAISPGAALRFLPLATALSLVGGGQGEVDAPARRLDLADDDPQRVADADRGAG